MKKILFVVPSLETGGTISSLTSIIDYIGGEYNIDILALSHDGVPNNTISSRLLHRSFLLHSFYCAFSNCFGYEKYIVILVKLLKRLCSIFRLDIERFLCYTQMHKYTAYDIVIAFQEGNATKYVSYVQNIKRIAWVHCDYQKYSKSSEELYIYSKFSSIICVSNFTANTFSKVYPTLQSRIRVIYNLLNISKIQENSIFQLDDSRFNTSTFSIISVGRVHKVKRFESIASIASMLKSRGCVFMWYIIGPNYNDECFSEFIDSIKRHNVSDCVIYLGNKVNPYPYIKNVNLLVSLSQTEACPMIFNEAKVLGVPIVTTDFGSSYEFIADGEYGIISQFNTITDVLQSVIQDSIVYNRMKNSVSALNCDNETSLRNLRLLFS